MNVRKAKISDLKTLGDRNPNKGTERGVYMVESSLEKFGAWRSIAVDADGNVVAGNHTLEAAAAAGIEDVLIVESDGKSLVVVQRSDIAGNDPRSIEYAVADNRASQVGLQWDADQIKAIVDELDNGLDDWFRDWEIEKLAITNDEYQIDYDAEWEGMPEFEQEAQLVYHTIKVHFMNEDDMLAFARVISQNISKETKAIYHPQRKRVSDES